jgi:hypothetical protein
MSVTDRRHRKKAGTRRLGTEPDEGDNKGAQYNQGVSLINYGPGDSFKQLRHQKKAGTNEIYSEFLSVRSTNISLLKTTASTSTRPSSAFSFENSSPAASSILNKIVLKNCLKLDPSDSEVSTNEAQNEGVRAGSQLCVLNSNLYKRILKKNETCSPANPSPRLLSADEKPQGAAFRQTPEIPAQALRIKNFSQIFTNMRNNFEGKPRLSPQPNPRNTPKPHRYLIKLLKYSVSPWSLGCSV